MCNPSEKNTDMPFVSCVPCVCKSRLRFLPRSCSQYILTEATLMRQAIQGRNKSKVCSVNYRTGAGFRTTKSSYRGKAVTFSIPRNANQGHFISRGRRQRPFRVGTNMASEQRAGLRRQHAHCQKCHWPKARNESAKDFAGV